METNYPAPVMDWMESIHDTLSQPDAETNEPSFYQDCGIVEEHGKEALFSLIGPPSFASWIDTGNPAINMDQMSAALEKVPIAAALIGLKKKGLLESIEDENGEEVFWLSDTGKKAAQLLKTREI
jgi:hypothetical protein